MGKASREKGKRGEREAASFLRGNWGLDAKRGRQYQGGDESPDVKHSMDGVLVEVKRTERLELYPSVEQAQDDAGLEERGIVLHRRNGKPWLLIMHAQDFPLVVVDYLHAIGVDTEALGIDGKLF